MPNSGDTRSFECQPLRLALPWELLGIWLLHHQQLVQQQAPVLNCLKAKLTLMQRML